MADVVYLSVCLALLLSSLRLSMALNPLPDITEREFMESCVNEHNHARTSVNPSATNMRYMTWDAGLADLARSWSRRCLFKHNPQRVHPVYPSVGENIWAGTFHNSFDVKAAIQSWIKEAEHYDYHTQRCSRVCGHYTQVVWATTYKVGCAVISCPDGVQDTSFSQRPGAIFVCNYATTGNYAGTHPYREGAACSECEQETCESRLCRNTTRDAVTHISWTPDAAQRVCGVFCKSVLIIRPVTLLLIFGSVYIVQRCCPNIFAYVN